MPLSFLGCKGVHSPWQFSSKTGTKILFLFCLFVLFLRNFPFNFHVSEHLQKWETLPCHWKLTLKFFQGNQNAEFLMKILTKNVCYFIHLLEICLPIVTNFSVFFIQLRIILYFHKCTDSFTDFKFQASFHFTLCMLLYSWLLIKCTRNQCCYFNYEQYNCNGTMV